VSSVGSRRQLRLPLTSRARPAPSPPAMMCERRYRRNALLAPQRRRPRRAARASQCKATELAILGCRRRQRQSWASACSLEGSADRWPQLPDSLWPPCLVAVAPLVVGQSAVPGCLAQS
jgi:hypothetical protein